MTRFLALVLLLCVAAQAAAAEYAVHVDEGHRHVTVAQGDRIDASTDLSGTAQILENCGVIGTFWVYPGFSASFDLPNAGSYQCVITGPDGTQLATVDVDVVATSLETKEIADELGYERQVVVAVSPPDAPIRFQSSDPSLLAVGTTTVSGGTASFTVTTLARGDAQVQAVIDSPAGPAVIAAREVDEFTVETAALYETVINAETQSGSTTLVVRPFVPDVDFHLDMFAHSSRFVGGATSIIANTSRDFRQEVDPATGETVGVYDVGIEMPADEIFYCFAIQPFQDDPVPVGGVGTVNGHGCKITVSQISLCVHTSGDLVLQAVETAPGLHPVRIVKKAGKGAYDAAHDAVFTDTHSDLWGQQFDCSRTDPQLANVTAGDHCEIYDVKVGDTIFTDRIFVSDYATMSLRFSGDFTRPPEFDKGDTLAVRLGTNHLGINEIGFSPEAGATATGAVEIDVQLCAPTSDTLDIQQDIQSQSYVYKPTDPVPAPSGPPEPLTDGTFGPPEGNDTYPPSTTDLTPSDTNRIYGLDSPGFTHLDNRNDADGTILAFRANFTTWLTVNGSYNDCLPNMTWHVRITLKKTASGYVAVGQNDIGPGTIDLGFGAGEANPLR